ncbi:MAG: hypothetical protein KKD44_15880 [Proteobacteria bacterium]|nr:hypothetical protein [Pseudomonadota bacterium]
MMSGSGMQDLLQASDSSSGKNTDLFGSMDSNGDGTVDAREFKTGLNSLIDKYLNQSFLSSSGTGTSGSLLSLEA